MKLSVVIPAHNEEGCIRSTVENLVQVLDSQKIEHEVLIVNDNSSDQTEFILQDLSKSNESVRYVNNSPPNGFGFAVRCGLESFDGDCVAVYMADASDSPEDLIRFFRKLEEGFDCVFGTRWSKGGKTFDYPFHKRILNRIANYVIRILFQINYDDATNAFKLYHRKVINGIQPFLSHHFNITVELPIKAIIRGYSYTVIPNSWTNRTVGESKLRIREMGSRYLFIMLYCLIEKWLSRQDYHRNTGVVEKQHELQLTR